MSNEVNWAALRHELGAVQRDVYNNAVEHGFWDEPIAGGSEWTDIALKASLVMCEGAELIEALRDPDPLGPCKKIPALNKVEEEIADIIIRSLDIAERLGIDVGMSIRLKHEHNKGRPPKHGKAF